MRRDLSLALLLIVLVLFTRGYAADRFVTWDEPAWVFRSAHFIGALAEGELASTMQSGHPGVTTMWIGALSLLWRQWVGGQAITEQLTAVQALSAYDAIDADSLRLLVALLPQAKAGLPLAHALIALSVWLLLRRLLDWRYALVAVSLLVLDPYYMGLSRLLHLDALMAGLMLVAVLAAAAFARDRHCRYLVIAGVATGLAVLTRTVAGIVVLFVVAQVAIPPIQDAASREYNLASWRSRIRSIAIYGLITVATVFMLWPAMWQTPLATLRELLSLSFGYVDSATETTRFYLGRVVDTPDASFYGLVSLLRSTPLAILGCAAALAELWHLRRSVDPSAMARRRLMLGLLAFAFVYTLLITASDKKYDRYLLPALLPLCVVAAVGAMGLAERLAHSHLAATTTLLAAVAVQGVLLLAPLWPLYPLAYYNPLAGGLSAANWALESGWGEGLEQAVRFLNAQPDADHAQVATHAVGGAASYSGPVSYLEEATVAASDYILLYHTDVQFRDPVALALGEQTPAFVAEIAGHPYAWVYANPYNATLRRQVAEFAEGAERIIASAPVSLDTTEADILRIISSEDAAIAAAELGEATEGVEELLLVDLHGQTSDEDSILVELLNQGAVLLDRQDFKYYSLLRYALPESRSFGRARASIATSASFDHVLSLESYGLTAIRIEERSELGVALRWRVTGTPLEDYHVSLRVTDDRGYKWGQYDALLQDERGHTVHVWQQDQTYDTLLAVSLTEGVPPGSYCLGVRLYKPGDLSTLPVLDASGHLLGTEHTIACIQVTPPRLPISSDRLEMRQPVGVVVGDGIELLGFTSPEEVVSGDRLAVWLCWKALATPAARYHANLTLLSDSYVAASVRDHPLGSGHPTDRWQAGESACYPFEMEIAPDTPSGEYGLTLGLLDPAGRPLLAESQRLGDIAVTYRERLFRAPAPAYAADARFGEQIALLGYSFLPEPARPGDTLRITLQWQALSPPSDDFTVFVHLVDDEGTIYAQRDVQPADGNRRTDGWVAGEIVLDVHEIALPADIPARTRLSIGLYSAETGRRLPAYDSAGNRLADDRLLTLPVLSVD